MGKWAGCFGRRQPFQQRRIRCSSWRSLRSAA